MRDLTPLEQLERWWAKASYVERAAFRDFIDTPVMDRAGNRQQRMGRILTIPEVSQTDPIPEGKGAAAPAPGIEAGAEMQDNVRSFAIMG